MTKAFVIQNSSKKAFCSNAEKFNEKAICNNLKYVNDGQLPFNTCQELWTTWHKILDMCLFSFSCSRDWVVVVVVASRFYGDSLFVLIRVGMQCVLHGKSLYSIKPFIVVRTQYYRYYRVTETSLLFALFARIIYVLLWCK